MPATSGLGMRVGHQVAADGAGECDIWRHGLALARQIRAQRQTMQQ